MLQQVFYSLLFVIYVIIDVFLIILLQYAFVLYTKHIIEI